MAKPKPTSKANFARRLGVSKQRLDQAWHLIPKECVVSVKRGKAKVEMIADPTRAEAAWKAATYPDRRPLTGRGGSLSGAPDMIPLAEARARLDAAKAALAELDLAERQGEIVKVAEIDARLVGLFRRCMTRILGVPARARQQDPGLTPAQLALFDSLLREALEELAAEAVGETVEEQVQSL